MDRVCERCGAGFQAKAWHIAHGRGRFCSQRCAKLAYWSDKPQGAGYRFLRVTGHPLADAKGVVREHRLLLYGRIGPGPHPCHWCGKQLDWRSVSKPNLPEGVEPLTVDHLDEDKRNNDAANLVPSCHRCNIRRSSPRELVRDDELFTVRPDGTRSRALARICQTCGADFLAVVSQVAQGRGLYCSRSCARKVPTVARSKS
jgi:hypothetical protein